jgi:hypothetical protein
MISRAALLAIMLEPSRHFKLLAAAKPDLTTDHLHSFVKVVQ